MALCGMLGGGSSADASQPGGKLCQLRIGSFNVGVGQTMLTGRKARAYVNKTEEIIATCVQDAGLNIMNLCELGGHRLGLAAAGIDVSAMPIFEGQNAPYAHVSTNYLTAWGFEAESSQCGVRAAADPQNFVLSSTVCEPLLVVHSFEHNTGVRLILGNLHIRIPQGATVSLKLKQRMVSEALQRLELEAPPNSATQPVVKVLLGDCNLQKDKATEGIQSEQPPHPADWRTVWQVLTTSAGLGGDLMFVKGAHAVSFDLPFGFSHRDRGVRHDCHDAIGMELRVVVAAGPEPEPKRVRKSEASDGGDASAPASDGGDAPQPASDGGDAPQPAPAVTDEDFAQLRGYMKKTKEGPAEKTKTEVDAGLVDDAASPPEYTAIDPDTLMLEKQIREFWDAHPEGDNVGKEMAHLRTLLFRKSKLPVPQDVWIPGASQPGEEQHVEAVVSGMYVLRQIKAVIELRATWLREKNLPMNCQMRDGFERKDFVKWAKDLYHAEPFQQRRQEEDLKSGVKGKVQKGKNSRWNRDLQRRLGSPALWYMVSFTGRFDASFLQKGDDATETQAPKPEPTKDLTRKAQKARDRLRWAESCQRLKEKGRTNFTRYEGELLQDLAAGRLHAAANVATRASGWGRIKHPNGTYEDIDRHGGGIVRTVLDNYTADPSKFLSVDERGLLD